MPSYSLSSVNMMDNVWNIKGARGVNFVTQNLTPGKTVYGERLFEIEDKEYREWQHKKSKLASGLMNGLRVPSIEQDASVLYLGASSGTTVSHVSDMIGKDGVVFAVEFSPRPTRDLYKLALERSNIIPILADARFPEEYSHIVSEVDSLYCDVAQPNQSELFLKNARAYLKLRGQGYIAIKTRSISQRGSPKGIFGKEVKKLEKGGFRTIKTSNISKIHRDHFVFLGEWT